MFESVIHRVSEDASIDIEEKQPLEVRVTKTASDAVEWTLFYYTKSVRKVLLTRHRMLRTVLEESQSAGISLATPRLEQRVGHG